MRNNSVCGNGYYHDFRIALTISGRTVEICTRCRTMVAFRTDTPNHVYLSYHLRQALQPYQAQFSREYPSFNIRQLENDQ